MSVTSEQSLAGMHCLIIVLTKQVQVVMWIVYAIYGTCLFLIVLTTDKGGLMGRWPKFMKGGNFSRFKGSGEETACHLCPCKSDEGTRG